MAEYALEFRTLAAGSRWNELVLKAAFWHGLNETVLTEMACRDLSLDSLIDYTLGLDDLLHKRPAPQLPTPSIAREVS